MSKAKLLASTFLIILLFLGTGLAVHGDFQVMQEEIRGRASVDLKVYENKHLKLVINHQVAHEPNLVYYLGIWAEGFEKYYLFGIAEWEGPRPNLYVGTAYFKDVPKSISKEKLRDVGNYELALSGRRNEEVSLLADQKGGYRVTTGSDFSEVKSLLQILRNVLLRLEDRKLYDALADATGVSPRLIEKASTEKLPPFPADHDKRWTGKL